MQRFYTHQTLCDQTLCDQTLCECAKSQRRNCILLSDLDMSTPASSTHVQTAVTVATTGGAAAAAAATIILPSTNTLMQAAKLAIEQDRAIMLDYYRDTSAGTAFLGEDPQTNERILVKSKEEFTSLIKKLYKVGDDFIILTENSLYIVSGKIQKRKVNLLNLLEAYEGMI
jgi:hypothetical protein